MKKIYFILALILICSITQAQNSFKKYPYLLSQNEESEDPNINYSPVIKDIVIRWQLDGENTNDACTISWGKESYTNTAVASRDDQVDITIYYHNLSLDLLDPQEEYMYKVEITNGEEALGTFVTPPLPGATDITFFAYGDTRGGGNGSPSPWHDNVCQQIITTVNPSSQTFILHDGDWICQDTETDWDGSYFNLDDINSRMMRSVIAVMGVLGNHEGSGDIYKKYWPYSYENSFYYSFDYGPAHFTVVELIDEWATIDITQKEWIMDDLETTDKSWKVMIFHAPAYSNGNSHVNNPNAQAILQPICEQYGVQLVIAGHNHYYAHWLVNGVHHLTLGGGGVGTNYPNQNIGELIAGGFNHFAKIGVIDNMMSINIIDLDGVDRDPFVIPVSYKLCNEENTVWENGNYYADEIRVCDGSILTIKTTVKFEEDGKIIIEQGGKLIIDGGFLTSALEDKHWQGIEVWGVRDKHQYTIDGECAQGYLVLKNEAIIENAVSAVELWEPGEYSTTGGIVQATDAIFRNNAKSIHALWYTNTIPETDLEVNNLSFFKECTFEVNEDYIPTHTFYKHVDLACVKGIGFKGCSFSVADVPGVDAWNKGIAAYSAGFSIARACTTTNIIPCGGYRECTFTGFHSAIYAGNPFGFNHTFRVNRAEFVNNTYGIRVDGVNNFSVLFSDFQVGHNSEDEEECEGEGMWASGYGISSSNASGFAIEENNFTKTEGAPPGNYTGIRVAENNATDEIYRNEFENLSYAIYAEGKNWRGTHFHEGLSLLCNDFTGSYRDIDVEKNEAYQGGIQNSQGSSSRPAGNDFINNTGDYKIYNNGNYPILYYYDAGSGTANPNPSYEVGPIATGNSNNCPSHYGGGSAIRTIVLSDAEKPAVEQEYLTALNNYNNVKTLYDNLQDGGDTEALKTEVEMAWPNETWELRAELLGKSPHLSTEVLKKAADKTDVLPESILFEILAANPDELRKEELIKYLEDKENPLPEYMIDILRQIAYGTTYKTALQIQMAESNRLKTRAANDMIRSILNDSITDLDELRNWLDNLDGIKADQQIIETYLAEGNVDDALALAGMIPQLYQLSNYDLDEHDYYMEMLDLRVALLQQGRNYDELTGGEVTQLEYLAQNSHGTAGAQARAILEQGYGHHFCDCLNVSGNQGFKSTAINQALLNQALGVSLSMEPNPARDWAAFDYTLPETESKGVIKITNATGKVIKAIEVSGTQGQYIWDTRNINPGVYFCTFMVNGTGTTSKLVITK